MKRVIYTSEAVSPPSEAELEDILAVARRKNEALGVTGILLFGGGVYIQVLEGDAETINALCMTIEQDARHTNFELLFHEGALERAFSDWTMAYRPLDAESLKIAGDAADADDLIEALQAEGGIASRFIAQCAEDLREPQSRLTSRSA